ncbi:MAG: type II secretion system protein [Magnetococcales bacterium]|nr:type II secretion system protein [Magnetococcales bacterium]
MYLGKNRSKTSKNHGFTLAEVAIVLVIMGVLLSLGISAFTAQKESAALKVTKERQKIIKEAMINFLRINMRLPCPDTEANAGTGTMPDGVENCTVTPSSFGILPWDTLGVSRSVAMDGWENFFLYHVSTQASTNGDLWTTSMAGLNESFLGEIYVRERNSAGTLETITSATAPNAVFVLVSHGPNGDGAYTAKGFQNIAPIGTDELDNTNGITDGVTTVAGTQITYTKRGFNPDTGDTNGAFDDVVFSVSSDELVGPLIEDGTLKTAGSLAREQLTDIKASFISYMLDNFSANSCAFPTPMTTVDSGISTSDPWGTALYYPTPTAITSTVGGSTTMFTITSKGPDRTSVLDGGAATTDADNLVISMTKQEGAAQYVAVGATPPPCLLNATSSADVNSQLLEVRSAIIGYMLDSGSFTGISCSLPAPDTGTPTQLLGNPATVLLGSSTSALATDPWGTPILYTRTGTGDTNPIVASLSNTTTLFTIQSYGPDTASGNDDTTISMTKAEARGIIAAAGVTIPDCLL